ncbi:MAG: hypothetical protein P4L84_05030 [Isosphaeraceae bacterium]|nr:hypothetical protein [Isosphaeraceae bacterium]
MKDLRATLTFVAARRTIKRTAGRPAPLCESLEGRQLLNANWGTPGAWDPSASGATSASSAEVHRLDLAGAKGTHDGTTSGTLPAGFDPGGKTHAAPSAQAKADMQTLQTDLKAFQAEIPASLTATMQADQAAIKKALDALTPAERKALIPSSPPSSTTSTDPMTQLQTLLTGANVPNASQIVADFQNYETTVKALDPTLQTKIATDQANLAKDLGITAPSGTAVSPSVGLGLNLGFPGGPGGFGGLGTKGGHDPGLGISLRSTAQQSV